jgi:hypothetical protein
MLTDEERDYLQRMTRVMQIIVAALAFGAASFFGIVLVLPPPAGPGGPDERLMTYLSIAVGLGSFCAAMILPGIIARNQRREIASGRSLATLEKNMPAFPEALREIGPITMSFQTVLIIRSALLEGGTFFALIAFMIERQAPSLVVAGVLILALVSGMPTRSKVEEAIDDERRQIELLRQMEPIDAR